MNQPNNPQHTEREMRVSFGTLIFRIVVATLAVYFSAYILPGITLAKFTTAIIIALAIGVLNVTIRPLLIFFTLPATLISFGLFLFVINAVMILIAAWLIPGFEVNGFWWALLFSLVLSIVNSFLLSIGRRSR